MGRAIVLLVTLTLLTPALGRAGEGTGTGGEAARGTTVKSGKSNSSERASGAEGASERATTVKSSKSNSSDRAAGEPGTTVKGSKSNSSE